MTKDTVSNKELYIAIMDVHKKIDEIVDKRITPLEMWKAELTGKLAIVGAVVIISSNLFVSWIKERFKV